MWLPQQVCLLLLSLGSCSHGEGRSHWLTHERDVFFKEHTEHAHISLSSPHRVTVSTLSPPSQGTAESARNSNNHTRTNTYRTPTHTHTHTHTHTQAHKPTHTH